VVPNRIFAYAAKSAGLDAVAELELAGDTAMVTATDDPVKAVRVLRDFAKKNQAVAFKGGILGGKKCSPQELDAIASLPAKPILQAQLLGVLSAPAQKLVGTLQATISSVVYAINAYKDKKENAA